MILIASHYKETNGETEIRPFFASCIVSLQERSPSASDDESWAALWRESVERNDWNNKLLSDCVEPFQRRKQGTITPSLPRHNQSDCVGETYSRKIHTLFQNCFAPLTSEWWVHVAIFGSRAAPWFLPLIFRGKISIRCSPGRHLRDNKIVQSLNSWFIGGCELSRPDSGAGKAVMKNEWCELWITL